MKKSLPLCLYVWMAALSMLVFPVCGAEAAVPMCSEGTCLVVAPDGGDWNDGVSAPLGSIEGAVSRLRALRQRGELRLPARIVLRGGVYRLKKTLELDTDFPLTIASMEGERAILDGGVELQGWHETSVNGKKAWRATAGFPVKQLYFRGRMLRRAAFPKQGMFRIQNTVSVFGGELGDGGDHFTAEQGSFNPSWHNPAGIDIFMTHKWIEEYLPVKSFDPKTQELYSTHRTVFLMQRRDTEYRLENVREALQQPGEFYYDSTDGTVTVILDEPLAQDGERPVATRLGCLVRVDNARFLNLRGLTFRHGGGYRPRLTRNYDIVGKGIPNFPLGNRLDENSAFPFGSSAQAAVHVPGTIFLANCSDCEITGCTVTATGWYGIEAGPGCSRLLIDRNELCELGAGGIRIGGSPANGPAELRTSRIIVTNNHIHDGGLVHPSGIGVLITHAFGNLVEHNHIHDLRYSGVSAGWCWGYGETVTRENRIGWNYIHDLGKEVVSDMGGVYLLGIQPGTRVYNNYIANVKPRYYGGWGVYLDQGASHIVVENNICTDCFSEGVFHHYGRENTIRHNIFAFGGRAAVCIAITPTDFTGLLPGPNCTTAVTLHDNVLVSDGKPFFHSALDDRYLRYPVVIEQNNLFHHTQGDFPPVADDRGKWSCDMAEWGKRGLGRGAILGTSPGFRDLARRDFSFPPDSALGKMHFPQLDRSQVGILPPPPPPPREGTEWSQLYFSEATRTDLPRVFLIGDSIVGGEVTLLTRALKGKATIAAYYTSKAVADPAFHRELAAALAESRFDLIVFNNGLHGFAYSDEQYRRGLEEALALLLRRTGAKLLWRNSTPVTVPRKPQEFHPKHNPIVLRRNQIAAEVMAARGIPVIDLYTPMAAHPEYSRGDGYHYTPEGNAAQIQILLPVIQRHLPAARQP